MQSQLDLFPMGTPGDPTIAGQDAFLEELDTVDLAGTLVRAARSQPLTLAETQKLLLLAADLDAGHYDLVSRVSDSDQPARAFIAPF